MWMEQVHGRTVAIVDGTEEGPAEATDALVTTRPGVALVALVADCVPVSLGDPEAGVVAAVHAGRVGARVGVVPAALEAMRSVGARPDRIEALLGPAICGECYEVPKPMADDVEKHLPGSACRNRKGTPALDLRAGVVEAVGGPRGGTDRSRSAVHDGGRDLVESPQECSDWKDCGGHVDGTVSSQRSEELATALRKITDRIEQATPTGRSFAGRGPAHRRDEDLPRHRQLRLLDLGVRNLGENRDQEAVAKVREVGQLRRTPTCVGTWSADCSATRPGRWRAGPRRCSRWTPSDWPTRSPRRCGRRRRPESGIGRSTCSVQASLDDDPSRGGCPIDDLSELRRCDRPKG